MTSHEGDLTGTEGGSLTIVNKTSGLDIDNVEERLLIDDVIDNAHDYPEETAIRWKRLGIWQEITWLEYLERIRDIMLGLETLEFGTDDILFTIGYNRPQQVWIWFAAQSLGGIPAANYAEMLPEDIAKQINLTEAKIAYAEDQEMVDKLLAEINEMPSLETIIYRNEKGMFRYEEDAVELLSYAEVEQRGREAADRDIFAEFEDRLDGLQPTDTAMLSPTSGTTGMPKRTQLSHHNFMSVAHLFLAVDPLEEGSDYFSMLPMPWIGEPVQLMGMAPQKRWVINFAEMEETTNADLREIGPEFFLGSPAMYEGFVADIKAKIENTTRLKRIVYDKAMEIGDRYASYVSGENSDQDPPLSLRLQHWLSYWVAYRPILDKVGLKRTKQIYTGGAPLGEEHFQYFHALGLNIKQVWGQTETCGYATVHPPGDIQMDTTGKPLPNVEIAELDTGELVVRGPTTASGYYNQPEKTAETIEDGWIHTDDFGTITDDGHIKVFDRMDDVIEMEDGNTVAPISIETRLKFNPYVKEAMVVGDGRPNLTAILNMRYGNVSEWADQNDIQYSGYNDLSQHPAVLELFEEIIRETNAEQNIPIERFVLLFKEFNPDDGEITQTGKLRREPITEKYKTLLDAMYDDTREEIEITVTVTYSDGRDEEQTETVPIQSVEEVRNE